MKKLVNSLCLTALCACSLSLGLAPKAHAQQAQPKVLAVAQADTQPFVGTWLDGSQGTQLDTQSNTALFAGSKWAFLDNGEVIIQSSDGKTSFPAGYAASQDLGFAVLHAHTTQGTVDGMTFRDSSDPTQGTGMVFITVPAKDQNGKPVSLTFSVITALTFR